MGFKIVTREDRRMINEVLTELEQKLNSNSLPFDELLKEVQKWEEYFNQIEIQDKSDYRKRLDLIRERASQDLEDKKIKEFVPEKYKYSGVFIDSKGAKPVKIILSYDHLFLSRHYKFRENLTGAKISWRFERDGKLYLIDFKELPSGEIFHLIKPANSGLVEFTWRDSLNRLIPQVYNFHGNIAKLELLAKWGHTCLDGLYEAIQSGSGGVIRDSNSLKGDEKGLTQISMDQNALEVMNHAYKRVPRLSQVAVTLADLYYN